MKITSASKKVLASALSAAMVVAFAPTVAFGADATGGATLTYVDKAGATKTATYDTVQKAVDEAAKANGTKTVVTLAGNATIDSDLDIAGVADGLTLDLAGYTLSASQEFYEGADTQIIDIAASKAGTASYTLGQYISGDKALIATSKTADAKDWKDFNGTLGNAGEVWTIDGTNYEVTTTLTGASGTAGYFTPVVKPGTTVDTGKVTIKNGTIDTIKAEKSYDGIKAAADVVLDGVTIAAEAGKKAVDAYHADVTVKGESNITAKGDADVWAIYDNGGKVTVEGGTVSAISKTDVAAIQATDVEVKGGKISAEGKSADKGVKGTVELNTDDLVQAVYAVTLSVKGGEITATTTSDWKNGAFALYTYKNNDSIKSGTINGKLYVKNGSITGGTFSEYLAAANDARLAAGYAAADNGTTSVVYKNTYDAELKSGTDELAIDNAVEAAATNAIDDIFGNIAAGNTVGYTIASGYTADDVKAIFADEAKAGLVRVQYVSDSFEASETTLTDAEKAVLAEAKETAAKTLDKVTDIAIIGAEIQYRAAGEREYSTIATITDLGSTVAGRNTVKNAANLGGKYALMADGALGTKLEKTKNAGADGYWASAAGTWVLAEADPDAIKDVVDKPETPAAPEKATQSIDVAKKSLTVKLGAKKTKTAKGKSFNMGATAETAVTTAWKSGSTKITVSGDKVKLAKGVKRGTYKAQVSLKAAGSDEFLAAAATITVKFVIK